MESEAHPQPPPEVPGVRLVRRLAASGVGSGDLFLGVRDSDRREVAVRLFRRPLSGQRSRLRFTAETDALRVLIAEPHLVKIFDAGVGDGGQAYLVMEFCPDGSLDDHLALVGRLTPEEVTALGVKLAGALARLHRFRILHRNLTPSNVLLTCDGEPVLADFGLLALATADRNFSAPPSLPNRYAAPEAFLPELMTPAADIYSLGAVLYALLAGDQPPKRRPEAEWTVPVVPGAPPPLMAALRRALEVDTTDRYADAEDLRAALATAARTPLTA